MKFQLRFPESEITVLAARYRDHIDDGLVESCMPAAQERGWLTKEELAIAAHWKSVRSAPRVQSNGDHFIEEITGFALSAKSERAHIEALTLLDGVGWPTASVLLHFFHREPYPVLDYRALWSLQVDPPENDSFEFWWTYVEFFRGLQVKVSLTPREIDQALWQFSKENQPARVSTQST